MNEIKTSTLRVNRIDLNGSVADGPGLRTVVFFQGCDRKVKCAHCHNPSSHLMSGGEEMSISVVVDKLLTSPLRSVTLSGGEPLAQREGLLALVKVLKAKGFNIALYTWRQRDQVPQDILDSIDWLKVGEFRMDLKTSVQPFVGSSNQQFLYVA